MKLCIEYFIHKNKKGMYVLGRNHSNCSYFLAIAFGAYKLKKWNDEQDAYEQKRQEEAKKKAEFEAWQEKRKAIYKNHLPNIYGKLSRQKLEQIYPLLETMHDNKKDYSDPNNYSAAQEQLYWNTCEQLKRALGDPKWNIGNGWNDNPLWVTIDMNYVYGLLYH